MSPATNVTFASSSGDMIRASRRGSRAKVERHDRHAFAHQLADRPRPDAAERAGDEEPLRGPAGFRRHVTSLGPTSMGLQARTTSRSAFWPLDRGLDDTLRSEADVNGPPAAPAAPPRIQPDRAADLEPDDDRSRGARPLGRTGLEVTRLGFGGASIGGLFSAVDDDERDRHGPPRLGARRALLRHGAAVRLRRLGTAHRRGARRPSPATSSCCRPRSAASSGRRRTSRPAPTSTARRSTVARMPTTSSGTRCASSSTTAPTASAARSRRASNGSASTASTSR